MGLLRQFVQLLWKNYILRRRQPHVLLLEVVWPVFIFVIVVIIRYGTPPTNKATCSYNEHALPSAGLVPFLQSTVCNLQNPCEARAQLREKRIGMQNFAAAIQEMTPHFTHPQTLDALDSVGTGVRLAKRLGDISKNSNITGLMNDTNFEVQNFFRDPDKVKTMFVTDMGIMTEDEADALLTSTVNVGELLKDIGSIDFKEIACNATMLSRYMLFKENVNITQLSNSLCAIPDDMIPEITNVVQKQLDVAALIRVAETLTSLTLDYTLTDALSDIASLADLMYGSSTFMSLIKDIPELQDLPALLHKLPQLAETITKLGLTDLSWMPQVVRVVDPIVMRMDPGSAMWSVTKDIVALVTDISGMVGKGGNVNVTDIVERGTAIFKDLQANNISLELLSQVATVRLDNAVEVMSALFMGQLQNVSEAKILLSLDEIQSLTEMILQNDTNNIMSTLNGAVDLVSTLVDMITDLDRSLNSTLFQNKHLLDALKTVIEHGPNITTSVLTKLFRPENIIAIFNSSDSYSGICKKVLQQTLSEGYFNNPSDLTQLDQTLCNEQLAKNIESTIKNWTEIFEHQMRKALDTFEAVSNGTATRIALSSVYPKVVAVFNKLEKAFSKSDFLDYMLDAMDLSHMNFNTTEWKKFFNSTSELSWTGSWPVIMVTAGPYIQQSSLWTSFGPYIKTVSAIMQFAVETIPKLNEMTGTNSTMMKINNFIMDYSPEIVDAVMGMLQNRTMIEKMISQGFTMQSFCDNKMLQQLGMPSYVPVESMETMICNTNFTAMFVEIGNLMDITPLTEQIKVYMTNNDTNTDFNWENMVYNVENIMNLMSTEQNFFTDMFQAMNFTKITTSMSRLWEAMNQTNLMSIQNMMGSSDIFVPLMQQLDRQFWNSSEWNMLKNYINSWNSFVKLATKFLYDPPKQLDMYLSDLSPTFAYFMQRFNSSTPALVEALKNATLNPAMLLHKLLTVDLTSVCKGVRISDILDSAALSKYENQLCSIDWNQVYREIMNNSLGELFIETQENIMNLTVIGHIMVDWNETFYQNKLYFEKVFEILSNPENFTKSLDKFLNMNLGSANMTLQNLFSVFTATQQLDMKKLSEIADQIPLLMSILTNSTVFGNDTIFKEIMKMQSFYIYQQHSIMQFMIKQLQYFNNTDYVVLTKFINSTTFNRLLHQIADTPKMTETLFQIILNVMFNPQQMTNVASKFDTFCTDFDLLKPLLPANKTDDGRLLQHYICNTININVTVLLHEVSQSLDGFTQMIQAFQMDNNSTYTPVKYSTVIEENQLLSQLFTDVIATPPKISLTGIDNWINETTYLNEWTKFIQELTDKSASTNLIESLMSSASQKTLVDTLTSAFGNMTEFGTAVDVTDWLLTLIHDRISKGQYAFTNPMKMFDGYPEMQKFLHLMDYLPELFELFVYNAVYDPSQIVFMIDKSSKGFENFCNYTLPVLTEVPEVNISMVMFQQKVCQMNYTKLLDEISQYNGNSQLEQIISNTGSSFGNLTDVFDKATSVYKLLLNLANTTSHENATMLRFLQEKPWMDAVEFMKSRITLSDAGSAAGIQRIMDTITKFSTLIPSMFSEMSNMTMNNTFDTMFLDNTVQVFKFIAHQLTKFNSSQTVILQDYFNSTELNKIINSVVHSQDTNVILTQILTSMLFQPQKITGLVTSFESICTNASVFEPFMPPDAAFTTTQVQNAICGSTTVNYTVLMEEISHSVDGFSELVKSFQPDYVHGSVNYNDLITYGETIYKIASYWASSPPNIMLTSDNSWLNMNGTQQLWENFIQNLTSSLQTDNIMQLFNGLQKPLIQIVTSQFSNFTEFKTIIGVTDFIFTYVKNQMENSNGALTDLISGFNNYPELKRLAGILEQLPYFYQSLVYNAVYYPNKIPALISTSLNGWEGFCNHTNSLSDMPGQNFSTEAFQQHVCDVNFTRLIDEASKFQISNMSSISSGSASISDIIQKLNEIIKLVNSSSGLPKFLQEELWTNATNSLHQLFTDPTKINKLINQGIISFGAMLNSLTSQSPEIKEILRMYDIQYTVIDSIMSRLNNLKNDSILDITELLGNAENTKKLWNLIQQPGSIEVLLHSANMPQFQELIQKNMSEALLDLCDSSRGMFSKIFTVPARTTVNLTALQYGLCTINLTQLVTEWEAILDIPTIQKKLESSYMPNINWTGVAQQQMQVSNMIQQWIQNPPVIIGLATRFTNESYWLNLLMQTGYNSAALANVTDQLGNILKMLAPLLNQEPIRTYGFFVEKLLNLTSAELDKMAQRNLTDLKSVVHFVPSLEKLFMTLNLSEEVFENLMVAPLKNPSMLVELITNEKPLEMLCSTDFWKKLVTWKNSTGPISSTFCMMNDTTVVSKVMDSLRLTELLEILQTNNSKRNPDWNKIIDEAMTLFTKLEGVINSTLPKLNLESAWNDLVKLYGISNSSGIADFTSLLKLYGDLAKVLNNTQEWKRVNEFLATGEMLFDSVIKFVDGLVLVDQNQLSGLLKGIMNPKKISELFTMDYSNISSIYKVACNATAWREIFSFPKTTNVTALVNMVCVMDEKEISHFMATLMMKNLNESQPVVDIQHFVDTVQTMMEKFQLLMNTSRTSDINSTALWSQIQTELMNLQNNTSPLLMASLEQMLNAMNSTEVVEFVNGLTLWAKMLTSKLKDIANKPLNLSVILGGSSLDPAIEFLLGNEFIGSIGDLQVNPEKLMTALRNMSDSSHLCEGIIQSLTFPQDNSTTARLQELLCHINQSSLVIDGMSLFLSNHLFVKQFQAIIDEAKSGKGQINLTATTEVSTQFFNALTNLINKNWTNANFDNIFNITALAHALQRVEESLKAEIGGTLAKWSPLLLQSLGAIPDPDVTRAIQTINVIIQTATQNLKFLKGTVDINQLLQNSSVLIDYFRSLQSVTNNGLEDFKKMNITVLTKIVMTPGQLETSCRGGTLGQELGIGNSPWVSLLCTSANFPILQEAFENITDYTYLSNKLMEIWNSSQVTPVDWNHVTTNINAFTTMLTDLIDVPPVFASSLNSLLNFNKTIEDIQKFISDPQNMLKLLRDTGLLDDLPPLPSSLRGLYYVMTQMLTILNDTESGDGLSKLLDSLTTFDYRLQSSSSRFHQMIIMMEKKVNRDKIIKQVCDKQALQTWFGSFYADNMYTLVCTKSPDSWYTELMGIGYDVNQFAYSLMNIYYNKTGTEMIPELQDITWSEMLTQVQKALSIVMTSIEGNHTIDWENFINHNLQGLQLNSTVQNVVEWLKFMEIEYHMDLSGMLDFVVKINHLFNQQINRIKGMGHNIPLSVFLPNSTVLAKLINENLQGPPASFIFTAAVAPDKFMEVLMAANWKDTICNVTQFMATFRFPAGTDVLKVQQDLCKDFMSPVSVLGEIFHGLNVTEVLTTVSDWLDGKSVQTDKNIWEAVEKAMIQFADNILYIQHLNISINFTEWIHPIFETIMNANNQLSLGQLENTCNVMVTYMGNSTMYKESIEPVLLMVQSNMKMQHIQLQLQLEFDDFVCDMSSMNISSIAQRLESSNFTHLITELISEIQSQTNVTKSGHFQCSTVTTLATDISNLYGKVINETFLNGNKTLQCLKDAMMIPAKIFSGDTLDSIRTISSLVVDGLDMLNQPYMQNQELLSVITSIFKRLSSKDHSPSALMISQLISANTTAADKILDLLKLTPYVTDVFLNTTLSTEFINKIINGSEDVATILCTPEKLKNYLKLPSTSELTVQNISALLCGSDPDEAMRTSKIISDLLAIGRNTLALTTDNFGDQVWWSNMAAHLTDVIKNVQALSLFNLTSVDLNIVDMKSVLPYIQEFIYRNGPDVLAESIVILLEDFKPLMNDSFMRSVTSDIQVMVRGLTSLKAIRNFIPRTVLIRTVLKDPESFHKYLTQNVTLTDAEATAIIDGTISYDKLMELKIEDITSKVCNVSEFQVFLNVTSQKANITSISNALCHLNESQVIQMVDGLLQNMDLGKLVQQYVHMVSGKFLESIQQSDDGVTVQEAIEKLSDGSSQLNNLATLFNNKSDQLGFTGSFEALHGTGSDSVSSLYDMICGRNNGHSASVKDATGVSSLSSSSDTLTPAQEAEMMEMPGEFCQDLYKSIIQMSNGPVIWAYLKPLIMGKILYTPDTPQAKALIEKVYNSSFQVLVDVKKMADSWSSGTQDIGDLLKDRSTLNNVKDMVGNEFINNLLESSFQISTKDVMNGFYSLDSMSSNQVLNISNFFGVLANYTHCIDVDRFKGFTNEIDLEVMASKLAYNNTYLAGIVFDGMGTSNNGRKKRQTTQSLPKHVTYKIRMDIENIESTRRLKERFWRPYPEDDMYLEMRYFRGFIQLQDMLDQAIINTHAGYDVNNTVYLQQFPTPCYVNDRYMELLSAYYLPVMMTISWLAAMAVATRNLVYDRELGQEETLKIMGLNSFLNWWAWFLSTMLVMTLTVILCIVVLRLGNLFNYSDFGLIILYFLDFCFSSTMMCYMISSFFTRTTLAMLSVLIVYLLSYLPYVVLTALEMEMLFWQKFLACLSSTAAFGFGAQYVARFEIQMTGIQWSNYRDSPLTGDEMSFNWTLIMMALDGVIYLIIGWYIRHIKPGKYGVSQPWYFPVSPYFWGCMKSTAKPEQQYQAGIQDGAMIEDNGKDMNIGICLRHLSKKFGNKEVVHDLNCDFYEGQVTVLLGHNGAAKSTTINMIAGILEPTNGRVSIYGHNISKEKVGICPQQNALFHYMTVKEHLEFYASIKSSLSRSRIKEDIESLLRDVDLWHVKDAVVSTLSGGMQRRLCVALAFTGESRAVILDEPTSGVDPAGRRSIWNLLVQKKMRCTILLSTHFLDEADTIGDRVAVMHSGKIMCTGSPMFLKQKVGSGYHLKFVKEDSCNLHDVMDTIHSCIPDADILDHIGSEVTVSLPFVPGQTDNFLKCLHALDAEAPALGIGSYGIYDTTLEEVFHKVCAVADKNLIMSEEILKHCRKDSKVFDTGKETAEDLSESPEPSSVNIRYEGEKRMGLSGQKLHQFSALLIKRFHHYRRDWRMFMSIFLLPLVFVTASLGFMEIQPVLSTAPDMILTPPLYGPHSHAFVKDLGNSGLTKSMVDHLKAPPGMGTTCMAGANYAYYGKPFQCVSADKDFSTVVGGVKYENCSCVNYKYSCSQKTRDQEVPHMITNTTTTLHNLQDRNIELYLLQTSAKFRWQRFGGLAFDSDPSDPSMVKSTVWFNNKGRHAMSSFYNALSNTMLRATMSNAGHNDPEEYGITAINHPIMLHRQQLTADTLLKKASDVGIGIFLLVSFSFIPVGFIMYLINELHKKEKQLQFISGIGPIMYWFTAFLWDMCIYCITVAFTVAVMAIFRNPTYWARDNLGGIVVLAILYGWATIPLMYSTLRLFRDTSSAYMSLFCVSIFIGISTACCVFILEYFATSQSIKDAYNVMKYVFLIFPQFAYVNGFLKMTTMQLETDILALFGQDAYIDPFSYDMLGYNFMAMGIQGLIFFVVTLMVEISCQCKNRIPPGLDTDSVLDNEEVSRERQRIINRKASNNSVTVYNLSKVFSRGSKKFLAVDQICFGVSKGECFGLLGVNGAGKTTTFRMLTGDLKPSEGAAYLKNSRIAQGKSNLGQDIGYCPQEDALDYYLTGRETLHFYARLRGLPSDYRNYTVADLIQKLKLTDFADKAIHKYSGGMKRKLSVAVALLGEPHVVFLDEPTSGMDPASKRLVWTCLTSALKDGQSVLMTSHSMEECDALCTRLAIMVNGTFRCIGSSQLLKDKYGGGHIVTLYNTGLSTERHKLIDFFNSHFPGSICRDHHQGVLEIQVPSGHSSVADIIQVLEEQKNRGGIQHYSVSQTTLDNVFLNFARDQTDGITENIEYGSEFTETSTNLHEPFTNTTFAYMNPGYDADELSKSKFSSFVVSPDDIVTKM